MKTYTSFTISNLDTWAGGKGLPCDTSTSDNRDIPFRNEPEWMKRGLQQTTSGYGSKLNTGRMVHFERRWRRVYAICYSNCASHYFRFRGERIFLH